MKEIKVKLNYSDLIIIQEIVLEIDIENKDFIIGLMKGEYITTLCHCRNEGEEKNKDVEVLNINLERVGYVKKQYLKEEYFEILNVELY